MAPPVGAAGGYEPPLPVMPGAGVAQAPQPGTQQPQRDEEKGRWIRDDWQGHTQDYVDHTLPQVVTVLSDRRCDGLRQIVGSIFCGICCLPCAGIRLFRSCTDRDPMRVENLWPNSRNSWLRVLFI